MLNNFIYAKSKAMFEERIAEVPNEAIVFIEDTKEIWNHGHYFAGTDSDLADSIANVQVDISNLKESKLDIDVANDTFVKKSDTDSLNEIHWKYEYLDPSDISALQPYTIYYGGTIGDNVIFGVPMSGNVPDYYEVRALFWVSGSPSISFLTLGANQNLTIVWPNGIPEINEGYYELSIAVDLNARVAYAILVPFKEL